VTNMMGQVREVLFINEVDGKMILENDIGK
jgi:hypothetical protein